MPTIEALRDPTMDIVGLLMALLLPITVLAFIVDKLTPVDKFTGYDVPADWLNATFYSIFRLERFVIDKLNLPFGSSLLMISKPLG